MHRLVSWGGITPGHSAKFRFLLPVLTFNVSTQVIINVLWTGIWWILWTGENISLWLVQRRGVLPGIFLNRLFTHFLTFVRFLNISFWEISWFVRSSSYLRVIDSWSQWYVTHDHSCSLDHGLTSSCDYWWSHMGYKLSPYVNCDYHIIRMIMFIMVFICLWS